MKIPRQVAFFGWTATLDRILTVDNLGEMVKLLWIGDICAISGET